MRPNPFAKAATVVLLSSLAFGCAHRPAVRTEKVRPSIAQRPILELSKFVESAKFVELPAATFEIGSPVSEKERWEDEVIHPVTLTQAFQIQETVVTQSQWLAVMGFNPSKFKERVHCPKTFVEAYGGYCPQHPVDGVSWFDAQEFIQKMNERKDGFEYRLPTEAEWEYAARAGSKTAFYFGDDIRKLDAFAWHETNSGAQTHDVRTRKPNAFGLYDIHGNVFEWTSDWYDPYPEGAVQDPKGPPSGVSRVIRGGSYGLSGYAARSANRGMADPDVRSIGVGFRLVRTPTLKATEDLELFRDGENVVIQMGESQARVALWKVKAHLQAALFAPSDYRPEIRKQFDTYKRGGGNEIKDLIFALQQVREFLQDYREQFADHKVYQGFQRRLSIIEKSMRSVAERSANIHQTNEIVVELVDSIFDNPKLRAKFSIGDLTKPELPVLRSFLRRPQIATEFITVHPGPFRMGSELSEPSRDENEVLHDVRLTAGFEIQKTETTQLQWFLVMGFNPSEFRELEHCRDAHEVREGVELCSQHPVEMVSWTDVQNFIDRLNEGADGYRYRLPTEAEWEFAQRAGTQTVYSFGNETDRLGEYGWFYHNAGDQTRAVALKKPNPFGLYDMMGSVWEWTADWYAPYPARSVTGPLGPRVGTKRSIRGGSWFSLPKNLRSANRGNSPPESRTSIIGFRLLRTKIDHVR